MVRRRLKAQYYYEMDSFDDHCSGMVLEEMSLGTATDCIIRTQDKEFYCHRIILSFASSFLKDLLDNSPEVATPVIIIPDINTEAMNLAINIMYTGECCVHRSMRHELIELCRLLQLKGVEGLVEEVTVPRNRSNEERASYGIRENTMGQQSEVEMLDEENYDDEEEKPVEMDNQQDEEMVFIEDLNTGAESPTITFTFDPTTKQTTQMISVTGKKRKVQENIVDVERNLFEAKRPGQPRVVKTEAGLEIEYTPAPIPKPKIELDVGQQEILQERLEQMIIKTYKNLGTRGHETLSQMNHRARLVIKDDKMLKGNFNCVICDRDIAVIYTTDKKGRFKQWINSNMKRHMQRIHKDLHTPSVHEVSVLPD